MKFEIQNRQFKDKTIENVIIKMFEYFAVTNSERAEKIKKSDKNKEETLEMLRELVEYIEFGLKRKFSENFVVLINDNPNYAIKYEKNYLLGLKYLTYEIIIGKTPFICVPSTFKKVSEVEKIEEIENSYNEK